MSWQAFVDTSLVGTGHITKGAIISREGDSVWASSSDLQIKPAEMKVISSIIGGDDAAKDQAFAEGLYIGGSRYVMARVDDTIYARSGRDGVAIGGSAKAIVVGLHGETQVAGNATSAVVALVEHLKKTGY